MSKILFNPDNGAPIRDFVYLGVSYFTEGDDFMPGTLNKFEDDKTGQAFLNTFEFLVEMSPDAAKKLLSEQKLKCDKCEFETRVKAQLTKHEESHKKEKELDDLGIPVIAKKESARAKLGENTNAIGQKDIEDSENSKLNDGFPGLEEGDGLTQDRGVQKRREAIMS